MWPLLHDAVVAVYLVTPIAALLLAYRSQKRGFAGAMLSLFSTLFVGLALGTLLTVYYSHLLQNKPGPQQLVYCVYLASSALLIIRAADALMLHAGLRARRGGTVALWLSLRGIVLIALGIPLFMSGLLVYRPKGVSIDTPQTVLKANFTDISFDSDQLTLHGWWIPRDATTLRGGGARPAIGQTVLVCADDTATKAQVLKMLRPMRFAGFNVLMIDLRGQGRSGGYLTSLGDLERRDVLSAVRWLRSNHADGARTIVGLGVGTGGAALIAAAVDRSMEGQAIQSLAVYGVFDDTPRMLSDFSKTLFIAPLDRWIPAVSLPIASATVGTNLAGFSPASLVQKLWPRPIFVIHGVGDDVVDFDRGRALYDAASFPKQRLWVQKDRGDTIEDLDTARAVRDFFLTARPIRAI